MLVSGNTQRWRQGASVDSAPDFISQLGHGQLSKGIFYQSKGFSWNTLLVVDKRLQQQVDRLPPGELVAITLGEPSSVIPEGLGWKTPTNAMLPLLPQLSNPSQTALWPGWSSSLGCVNVKMGQLG